MMASRCTFATIEAAAIEPSRPSPPTSGGLRGRDPRDGARVDEHVVGERRRGRAPRSASPRDRRGRCCGGRSPRARPRPTARATAWRADRLGEALALGRAGGASSRRGPAARRASGSTTAAATTGPASGPMPTSSTPATTSAPARRSRRRSAKSAATRRRSRRAAARRASTRVRAARGRPRAESAAQDAQQARQGARCRPPRAAARGAPRAARRARCSRLLAFAPGAGRARRSRRARGAGAPAARDAPRSRDARRARAAREAVDAALRRQVLDHAGAHADEAPSPIAQLVGGAALGHEEDALARPPCCPRCPVWATTGRAFADLAVVRDHAPGCRSSRRGRCACSPKRARSMVALAPISTSSSITTTPSCGTFSRRPASSNS